MQHLPLCLVSFFKNNSYVCGGGACSSSRRLASRSICNLRAYSCIRSGREDSGGGVSNDGVEVEDNSLLIISRYTSGYSVDNCRSSSAAAWGTTRLVNKTVKINTATATNNTLKEKCCKLSQTVLGAVSGGVGEVDGRMGATLLERKDGSSSPSDSSIDEHNVVGGQVTCRRVVVVVVETVVRLVLGTAIDRVGDDK